MFFAVPAPTVKIPMPITKLWQDGATIRTSYGAAPKDLEESLMILSKREMHVEDMISHKLDLKEASLGFKLVAEGDTSLKVIIEPNRT